jgi:hypothetical protein
MPSIREWAKKIQVSQGLVTQLGMPLDMQMDNFIATLPGGGTPSEKLQRHLQTRESLMDRKNGSRWIRNKERYLNRAKGDRSALTVSNRIMSTTKLDVTPRTTPEQKQGGVDPRMAIFQHPLPPEQKHNMELLMANVRILRETGEQIKKQPPQKSLIRRTNDNINEAIDISKKVAIGGTVASVLGLAWKYREVMRRIVAIAGRIRPYLGPLLRVACGVASMNPGMAMDGLLEIWQLLIPEGRFSPQAAVDWMARAAIYAQERASEIASLARNVISGGANMAAEAWESVQGAVGAAGEAVSGAAEGVSAAARDLYGNLSEFLAFGSQEEVGAEMAWIGNKYMGQRVGIPEVSEALIPPDFNDPMYKEAAYEYNGLREFEGLQDRIGGYEPPEAIFGENQEITDIRLGLGMNWTDIPPEVLEEHMPSIPDFGEEPPPLIEPDGFEGKDMDIEDLRSGAVTSHVDDPVSIVGENEGIANPEVEAGIADAGAEAGGISTALEGANAVGSEAGGALQLAGELQEGLLSNRILGGIASAGETLTTVLEPLAPVMEVAGPLLAAAGELLGPISVAANIYLLYKDISNVVSYYHAKDSSNPRDRAAAQYAHDRWEGMGSGYRLLDVMSGTPDLEQYMAEGYRQYDIKDRARQITDQWKKLGRGGSENKNNWIADENLTLIDMWNIKELELGRPLTEQERAETQTTFARERQAYLTPHWQQQHQEEERTTTQQQLAAMPETGAETTFVSPGQHPSDQRPPWLRDNTASQPVVNQPQRDTRTAARTIRQPDSSTWSQTQVVPDRTQAAPIPQTGAINNDVAAAQ